MAILRHILLSSFLLCSLMNGALINNAWAKSAAPHANENSLDDIVAIVNNSVITQSEYKNALFMAKGQMNAENITPPSEKAFRKQVLDRLINNQVQLQFAEEAGIHVSNADLDKVVGGIAKDNGMSVHDFYERVAQEGLTIKNYRKQIQESMVLQRLQQQEVASRITVAPQEITNFLRTADHQTSVDKEYHLQDILVPLSDAPSPEEIAIAKKFADDILAKLQQGNNLRDLPAAETDSLQENDLSWRRLAEVPTAFTEPLAHMSANGYSGPIQTSNGFHIIHLVEVRSEQVRPKIPEKQEIAQLIFQRKLEESLQNWITKLRGQAFIEIHDKSIA